MITRDNDNYKGMKVDISMIYYIGYYADQERIIQRRIYLSAVNKMQYISSAINDMGYKQTIVSCSTSTTSRSYKTFDVNVGSNTTLHYLGTAGRRNVFTRIIDIFFPLLQLLSYLLKYVSSDDTVIVYHATSYPFVINIAKKIKKFTLILEVEEIYSNVGGSEKLRKKESRIFLLANQYIFPTRLLDKEINIYSKPSVIIHGTYQVEKQRICKKEYRKLHGWDEEKCHIVYAGTFDPRKGGVIAAVNAAEFLPDNYHVHILGFGSEKEIQNMKDCVADIASKSNAKITYDGLLSGETYIQFIQSCDIGLSTQNPNAAFNATSFPSKILSYMANGLRVVSIRIPAIEESAVGKYMYYYDEQTPEKIAKAILSVDMQQPYDSRKIIKELDAKFCKDLDEMLKVDGKEKK